MLQRKSLAPILALVSGLTFTACVQSRPAIKVQKITVGDPAMVPVNADSWYKGPKEIPYIKMHFQGYYTYNPQGRQGDYEGTYDINCTHLVEDQDDDTISYYDPSELIASTISTYEQNLEPVRDKESNIDVPGFSSTMRYATYMCSEFIDKASRPSIVASAPSKPATVVQSAKPSKSSRVRKASRPRRSARAARAPRPSGRD